MFNKVTILKGCNIFQHFEIPNKGEESNQLMGLITRDNELKNNLKKLRAFKILPIKKTNNNF